MKKRAVITGGAGFIGSNLALELQNMGYSVLVIDKFRNNEKFSNGNFKSFGHFKNLLDFHGEIYAGDIRDKKSLKEIEIFKPNVIFHQAAISDTTVSEQDEIMEVNLNSFKEIIKISQNLNSSLIYASSASTYGDAPSPQIVGKDEKPKNIYGYSKLMMDHLCNKFAKKIHIVGLRYFNVYGKGEFYKDKTASMVLQLGLSLLNQKKPRLFENSDKIFRDFIYIKDVISANILATLSKTSGVFNVATANARSFLDIANILQSELDTNYEIEYFANPFTSQYQFHTKADISKTTQTLGYEPKFSLEDGIKDYIPEIKRIFEYEC